MWLWGNEKKNESKGGLLLRVNVNNTNFNKLKSKKWNICNGTNSLYAS